MPKFVKIVITFLILSMGLTLIGSLFKIFLMQNYFENAGFLSSCIVIGVSALALYAMYIGIKNVWKLSMIAVLILVSATGCQHAKSNQQVLVSTDCGESWKEISAGNAVPKGTLNYCFMKVILPNWPMQGTSKFVCNLSEKVRVLTDIDYDYTIIKPLSFIVQAKYLGKANKHADDSEALDPSEFETAENMVIDKRLRDVVKEILLSEDIVELDQSEIEDVLLTKTNEILEPFGVRLNFISITFDMDEQTRQAIDVSTAMKIYRSKELEELGKQIMVAKAGAPKIVIENNSAEKGSENK